MLHLAFLKSLPTVSTSHCQLTEAGTAVQAQSHSRRSKEPRVPSSSLWSLTLIPEHQGPGFQSKISRGTVFRKCYGQPRGGGGVTADIHAARGNTAHCLREQGVSECPLQRDSTRAARSRAPCSHMPAQSSPPREGGLTCPHPDLGTKAYTARRWEAGICVCGICLCEPLMC